VCADVKSIYALSSSRAVWLSTTHEKKEPPFSTGGRRETEVLYSPSLLLLLLLSRKSTRCREEKKEKEAREREPPSPYRQVHIILLHLWWRHRRRDLYLCKTGPSSCHNRRAYMQNASYRVMSILHSHHLLSSH